MSEQQATDEDRSDADSVLVEVIEAVRACHMSAETLNETLTDIRSDQLQGEPTQGRLREVFDRSPGLRRVAMINSRGDIVALVRRAVEQGHADEELLRWFVTWWSEHQWVTNGIRAYVLERSHGPTPPYTGVEFEYDRTGETVTARHEMEFGLDRIHSIQAPAAEFFRDSVQRLRSLSGTFESVDDDEGLSQDTLWKLAETRETLEDVLDRVDALCPDESLPGDDRDSDQPQAGGNTHPEEVESLQQLFEFDDDEDADPANHADRFEDQMRGFY